MQLPQFDEVSHLAGRVKARAPLFGIGTRELEMLLAPLPPKETFEAKLRQLDAAAQLDDLRIPPGNRLEALQGNREGQYSIRINDQWRICFRFESGNAHDVEIIDYH